MRGHQMWRRWVAGVYRGQPVCVGVGRDQNSRVAPQQQRQTQAEVIPPARGEDEVAFR